MAHASLKATMLRAFYVNATYRFVTSSAFVPYVGAGLGVAQEVDIDLEAAGVERSLSGSGDIAYQVYGGVAYDVTPNLALLGAVRYAAASSITLDAENFEGGTLADLDYNPLTVQAGLSFSF